MTEGITLSPREQSILKLWARLQMLSVNFASKSRSELLKESEGTELSLSALNICQAFSRNADLTDKELFLLNYVANALKRSPESYAISRFLVNEPYIAETYKDMMEKRARLEPDYKAPCNIGRLLSLGREAVEFGTPRSYFPTDLSVFAAEDSLAKRIDCALKGYFPIGDHAVCERKDIPIRKEKKTAACSAAIIYTRDPEKADALEEFFKLHASTRGATSVFACKPEELFARLLSTDTGFTVNADALPEVNILPNMPHEYRALIKTSLAFFDKVIFGYTAVVIAAPKARLNKLCALARSEGFSVCPAISFKSAKEVTVTSQNKTAAKLGLGLLLATRDMIGHSAQVSTHDHNAVRTETSIEKIFEDTKGENAVYKTSVSISGSPAPYHEALYAGVGLILRAIADGFDLKNGELHFSVGARFSLKTPKEIGDAVAAILGLYRAETEFCVTDENSSVEYSEDISSLTLYLRAHSTQRREEAKNFTSIDPLLFTDLDENGLPDFENLRDFAHLRRSPCIIRRREV